MKKVFASFAIVLSATSAFAQSASSLNTLNGAIQFLNTDLSCHSDEDCGAVAIGHRACGGPESFVVVSVRNPHFEAIKLLAEKTEQVAAEEQLQNPVFGICSIEIAPSTVCKKKVCTTVSR